ncbi:MAG: pyridoxal phosphate-dependent aminotransferase [Holophagaceae bacterium]|nr:pyridoxal phosphate-dependent aminotransferase [Holophagaceae bacterium]
MKISTRLPDIFFHNSLTRLLNRLKRDSTHIFDLTISNPTECGFIFPRDEIITALANRDIFVYQPDTKGTLAARIAVSDMYEGNISPECIQLTASTSEAYSFLFKLLGTPGENIVFLSPCYPLLEWLVRLEGLACKTVPAYFHDGWTFDINAIFDACDSKTKAIVVINPNNPTGQFITKTEWIGLVDLATKKGLPLIVDEVFSNYPVETQAEAIQSVIYEHTPSCPVFILSGLSKVAILPQLKLAWIAMLGSAGNMADHLAFIADQYLSVSSPIANALPKLLEIAPQLQKQVLIRIKENLNQLDCLLPEHPHLSRLPVHGGWSVLIQRPNIEDDEICTLRLLSDFHLLIYPGHFFDISKNGFLIASLLPEPNIFKEAVKKLLKGLELVQCNT